MASPKQIEAAKRTEVRREFVAKMYCRERATYRAIAERLAKDPKNGGLGMRVTPTTICEDVQWLRVKWHQEMMANIGEVRARELQDLDEMEQQSVEMLQYPSQAGKEAQWFGARLAVKDKRSKILGLDAPSRHEHTGKDGGPIALTLSLVDMILQEAATNHDPIEHAIKVIGPADGVAPGTVTLEASSVHSTDTGTT